ncbi:MAG: DedA family protein [Flavobacteriales bacterium]
MESFWDLFNPETIIQHGGLFLLLLVIFCENGLVIGFFLPGDSLIFLSGLICASDIRRVELGENAWLGTDITTLVMCMFIAAVLGSAFGYWFGYRVGPPLFKREDSLIFKRRYLEMTQAFYTKHGGKTLMLGRFLPIIRTFAPIIAGVIRVPLPVFMGYNVLGAAAWIASLSLIGYFLGVKYPAVENYLGYIIIGFIGITTVIVARQFIRERRLVKAKE